MASLGVARMRAGRWTGVAAGALVLAILPGALRLIPDDRAPERAQPLTMGMIGGTPTTAPPPLPSDVPIVPPDDGLTGELAPVLPAPAPYAAARPGRPGEVFALVVGINDYPGTRHDLGAAVADADTVDQALAGFGVPAGNRVVLRDGQARRAQLVAAIRALVQTAGTQSTVVFAYAGHVRKLDHDTEAIVAADGGLLRDDELAALLAPLRTQHVWLLLASCYAGGFTEALAPGRILTAAADANSLAYESPSIHGSYLVYHLVREGWLEGKAGPSVQEAYAYAQARINELYPNRRPMEIDESGQPMRLGTRNPSMGSPKPAAQSSGPPSQGSQPQPGSPSSPPTTEPPERKCTLLVLCHTG